MRRRLRLALLAFLVASVVSFFGSRPPSGPVGWERSDGGAVEGRGTSSFPGLSLRYAVSRTESGKSTSTLDPGVIAVGQPLRASSVTIVGLGPEEPARRIAAELATELRGVETVDRADALYAGDSIPGDLLGDLILVFEVLRVDGSPGASASPLGSWDITLDGWMGHVPEFGWGEDVEMRQRIDFDWRIDLESKVCGLPFCGPGALAEAAADGFDLEETLGEIRAAGTVAPAFPRALLFDTTDLGSSREAVAALGVTGPPVYAGRRHLRKGEALWRTEGPDAPERLEAAIETLKGQGWKEGAGGSSKGVDGRVHLYTLRRGDEFVRLQYHENRTTRFQQFSSQRRQLPNGEWSEPVEQVEGEPLDPVVWLYYRHEASREELEALHARATERGDDVRAAFEANLPLGRRAELGLDVE